MSNKTNDMTELKNYHTKRMNNIVNEMYYLKIEGSSGHQRKGYGGFYHFVGGYFNPTELEGRENIVLDIWCDKNNLPYVTGKTFSEVVEKLKNFTRS